MQTPEKIAAAFSALSHKRRVIIYRALRNAGASGLNHSALQAATRLSPMSLSHHLGPMLAAGLVRSRRRGTYVFLTLNPAAFLDVADSLASEKGGAGTARAA